MRVMVIVKATNDSEDGQAADARAARANGSVQPAAQRRWDSGRGGWPEGERQGARVSFSGQDRSVTKGPFPNVSELVAGYWIWNVHDLNEAIEWVKRCPNPMPGPSIIEIRPLYEMEDFGRSERNPVIIPEEARNAEDR